MKKFLLILKGIILSIRNWIAEETLWYIRVFKRKHDKLKVDRIRAIADELAYKKERPHFVLKDEQLCKFVLHNWTLSYSGNIISPYITMCRKDYEFFARHTVNGKKALRKLNYLDIDKIAIYKTKAV